VVAESVALDEPVALPELEVGLAEPVALRDVGPWLEPPHPATPIARATLRAAAAAAVSRRRKRMREGLTTVAQHTQPT
jgi:hypothetical protein